MKPGDHKAFAEALRMMANLATAHSVEDVLAHTELIGLYLLGVPPCRVDRAVEPGVLQRVHDLEIDGVFVGSALVGGVGEVAIAWTGRSFHIDELEWLAPVIPLAQRTVERILGTVRSEPTMHRARGSEVMVSALVESIADPVWVLDRNYRLHAFNSAFADFVYQGFKTTAAIGTSVLSIPEPYRAAHLKIYQNVMRYGPRRMDWSLPDGSVTYDVFMHPIRDEGEVVGVAVTCRDVTESRQQAMHLQQARFESDRANQAKSAFLAQMSHEIRTPLNAIVGLTDLVLFEQLPAAVEAPMRSVKLNTQALLHLVSELLDFTAIEAGKLEIKPVPIDLGLTVRHALDLMQDRAIAQGIDLRCSLEPDLPRRIRTDPDRLRQILVNLLDNALKYTPNGQIQVTVAATDQLVVEVRDTGIGIAPENLSRIFSRFERLPDDRCVGGVGLGLSIAGGLAEALGGRLTATSELGVGSVFRLELPLEVVRWGSQVSAGSAPLRRPLRVLVVDDAPSNLAVTSALLKKAGHNVVCASNGEQALEQDIAGFDLLLMDVNMPGIGGIETARRIRARGVSVPIVALTAHAVKEVMDECIAAGMQGALVKPIPAATLEEEVLRLGRAPRILVLTPLSQATELRRILEQAGATVVFGSERLSGFDAVLEKIPGPDQVIEHVEALLKAGGKRCVAEPG